jgi:hypothetical protein
MDEEQVDEEQVTKWANLVPEVYYDLIARVPPGTFVILALAKLYHTSFQDVFAQPNTGAAVLFTILLLGSGYSVGVLLGPLGEFIVHRLGWLALWKSVSNNYAKITGQAKARFYADYAPFPSTPVPIWKLIQRSRARRLSTEQCQRMYRHIHEYLKGVDAQARVVLPKMQAEAGLCSNLAAGLIIVACAVAIRHWPDLRNPALIWCLLSLCLAAWAARFRTRRLMERHFSYFAANLKTMTPTTAVQQKAL